MEPVMEARTPELIALILLICISHPECCSLAQSHLSEILSSFEHPPDSRSVPKKQVRREIKEHLAELHRRTGHTIRPCSVVYRRHARAIARKHCISFNRKELKKQDDIIGWFGEHWEAMKGDLFTLFDKGAIEGVVNA
jgi:hypothetical protein